MKGKSVYFTAEELKTVEMALAYMCESFDECEEGVIDLAIIVMAKLKRD